MKGSFQQKLRRGDNLSPLPTQTHVWNIFNYYKDYFLIFLLQNGDQIKDGSALGFFVDTLVFAKEDSDSKNVAVDILKNSGKLQKFSRIRRLQISFDIFSLWCYQTKFNY